MNILCISGSATENSSNEHLLNAIPTIAPQHNFSFFEGLTNFPVFTPTRGENPPENVLAFKNAIANSDAVLISSPEYVHNIPAVLKNAFEWVTASGEFNEKKVVVMTYTPAPPRGEYAMASILESLKALNAKIIAELPLYKSELKINEGGSLSGDESIESLKALFEFLQ